MGICLGEVVRRKFGLGGDHQRRPWTRPTLPAGIAQPGRLTIAVEPVGRPPFIPQDDIYEKILLFDGFSEPYNY
jgi:hypothetical protein